MWTLKPNQPPFEMVDGPLAGRAYRHGQEYAEIPETEVHRFTNESAGQDSSCPRLTGEGEAIIAGLAESGTTEVVQAIGRKNRKLTEEASHAE